jgi:hypothetical protein
MSAPSSTSCAWHRHDAGAAARSYVVPPLERWGHTAVVVDSDMFVIGGFAGNGRGYLNDVHTLDCNDLSWNSRGRRDKLPSHGRAEGPTVRSNHAVCHAGQYVVVIAGSGKEMNETKTRRFNDVHILDTNQDSFGWVKIRVAPGHGVSFNERTYHAACALPDNIVAIFGGSTGTVDVQDVMLLSLNALFELPRKTPYDHDLVPVIPVVSATFQSLVTPRPAARRFHTLTNHPESGTGILFGGCHGKDYECFGDVWLLRHRPKSPMIDWSQPRLTGMAPEPRWGHTACVVGRSLVVVGGRSTKDIMDLQVLTFADHSLSSGTWAPVAMQPTPLDQSPCPRRRHTCCLVGDSKLILFGGFDGKRFLNDVYTCDIGPALADHAARNPAPRRRASTSAIDEAFSFIDPSPTPEMHITSPSAPISASFPVHKVPPPPAPFTKSALPLPPPVVRFTSSSASERSSLCCRDGIRLTGLSQEDSDLVQFFLPYYGMLTSDVVMAQFVRIKSELTQETLAEHVQSRLLPVITCFAPSIDDVQRIYQDFMRHHNIREIMSLLGTGMELDLREALSRAVDRAAVGRGVSATLDSAEKTGSIVIATARKMGWDRSDMLTHVKNFGYTEEQFYMCYQYILTVLRQEVVMDVVLDNIEQASAMDPGHLFRPDAILQTSAAFTDESTRRSSMSHETSQKLREHEMKLNALEDIVETALTCCITQDIMADPVATKYGHVYEREQILNWLQREETDPLTRQPLNREELIPLRNLKDAADKYQKLSGSPA